MKTFLQSLLGKTYQILFYLWRMLCYFVCGDNLQGEAMQSGELNVTGRDKVEINLGKHHPCRVVVRFKGGHHHVPCNPKHHDELRWELKNKHRPHRHDRRNDHCHHENKYVIMICWHVTDVRTIEWAAYY